MASIYRMVFLKSLHFEILEAAKNYENKSKLINIRIYEIYLEWCA